MTKIPSVYILLDCARAEARAFKAERDNLRKENHRLATLVNDLIQAVDDARGNSPEPAIRWTTFENSLTGRIDLNPADDVKAENYLRNGGYLEPSNE